MLGRWVAQCSSCDRPCDLFRSPVGDDDGVYDDGDNGDDDNDGVYDDGDGDDGDVYDDYYDDFTFHSFKHSTTLKCTCYLISVKISRCLKAHVIHIVKKFNFKVVCI